MYLGHRSRHVRRQGDADRRRPGDRRLGHRAARRLAAASRLVGAGSRPTGSRRPRTRDRALRAEPSARSWPRSRASACPARCTARRCSTSTTRCCARASCGTTRAPRRSGDARRRSAVPRDHRQHRLSRLHRAEARLGAEQRAATSSPRSRKVLLPKDYLRLWLTGEHVSEMSDAAGTSWLDTGARALVARAARGHRPRRASRCRRSSRAPSRAARCARELAARWGMGRGVVVAGGAGDNAASACGMGAVRAGARLRVARHVGRAVRGQCALSAQPGERRARLLPRAAGHLAPDGRDPVGHRFAELARRRHRQGRRPI